jgi:hypothetical protein
MEKVPFSPEDKQQSNGAVPGRQIAKFDDGAIWAML